jgi:hypothetical protein
MSVAQGINKTLARKVQVALGTAASGSGGQLLPRVDASFNVTKDTYENNLIASHQQGTGATHGVRKSQASLNGLAMCSAYEAEQAALLRKAWAATSAISSLSLTIAASGSNYTITRSAGDFLTGGIKVGDVIRLSGGSLDPGNVGVNCVVLSLTATVLTVNVVAADVSLVAEGPIASCTVTVTGKKTWVPTSGHTNLYFTYEEYFSDLTRSHVYKDFQPASMDVSMPATGNVTMNIGLIGLGSVSRTGSQVLTSPTAEPSQAVLSSVAGKAYLGASPQSVITSCSVNINGNVTHGEAVIGSNLIPDTQKGRITVSGSFSMLYDGDTQVSVFDDETTSSLILVLADDRTAGADFMSIVIPEIKLFSAEADDGEKQIVRTYNFTGQICSSGGAALANHQTIVSIQDSTIA